MQRSQETTGFLVCIGFVCLTAVRDVSLGGLFQRINPLLIVFVAFGLCTAAFLPAALIAFRKSLLLLWRRPLDLLWVNIGSASAWFAFMYALKLIEPSLVQILYSGIGPLSVIWIESLFSAAGNELSLTRTEWIAYLTLLAALVFSAVVVLAGLSGMHGDPMADAALGVILAVGGGVAISVVTMQCRKLNDAGVAPSALFSLRFPAAVASAAAVMSLSPPGLAGALSSVDAVVIVAALLIVVPSYVNQVAISLASPLTLRVVLAVGPVLIFFGQMIEGRLTTSAYSLVAAILYGFAAMFAATARQRAIRTSYRSIRLVAASDSDRGSDRRRAH